MSNQIIGRVALVRRLVGLAMIAAVVTPALAASTASAAVPRAVDAQGILAVHNQERAAFGFQDPMSGSNIWPLSWSNVLSGYAQQVANTLANKGLPQKAPLTAADHTPQQVLDSLNQGESLLKGWPDGYWTDDGLIKSTNGWVAEKHYFIFGMPFEQSSTTGDWHNVGHYTQMIWYSTTSVGCAKASDTQNHADYLVCRYQPQGNKVGQSPTGHTNVLINDVSRSEGNYGSTPFTFTVSLTAAIPTQVFVRYYTTYGTATSDVDYGSQAGYVMFMPGETKKALTIWVRGDIVCEPNETFFVGLHKPTSNARILGSFGQGTIVNDDYTRGFGCG